MAKLILLRHGQSDFNAQKKFTGWLESHLTELGKVEASLAGYFLLRRKIPLDLVFVSVLDRAIETFKIVNSIIKTDAPVEYTWKLNERHYGDLQGVTHEYAEKMYGVEQVLKWRRSPDERPPLMSDNKREKLYGTKKYKGINKKELPLAESLFDTMDRVIPFYVNCIEDNLKYGKNCLVVAHGNSIRALLKHLLKISDDKIVKVEVPTGIPIVFDVDDNLKVVKEKLIQ